MKRHVLTMGALVLALGAVAHAQGDEAAARQQAERALRETTITPLKVDIVLSRVETESGETVSSLPYTLLVNSNDGNFSTLNMGADVPVQTQTMMTPTVDGQPQPGFAGHVTYRPVGIQINCRARALEEGRFALEVRIEDDSVYEDDDRNRTGPPVFRSFKVTNNLVLRDGQSVEFTAAADRISGEVVRATVTLDVLE